MKTQAFHDDFKVFHFFPFVHFRSPKRCVWYAYTIGGMNTQYLWVSFSVARSLHRERLLLSADNLTTETGVIPYAARHICSFACTGWAHSTHTKLLSLMNNSWVRNICNVKWEWPQLSDFSDYSLARWMPFIWLSFMAHYFDLKWLATTRKKRARVKWRNISHFI